mmetsp:Transcript_65750/g.109232  ORF Transcript_65750/g.109232 Transcript_65750/m.109232 type:complete len:270 (-) Transcript_65750:3275-4084(-)
MQTALQSSNWPEPASKNISCDLCSNSIMCCVLSSDSFFSWKSCLASVSLACCLARRTLLTPSCIARAKRSIVPKSSACKESEPKPCARASTVKEQSLLCTSGLWLGKAKVDWFRPINCAGQSRRPSGISGCVASMKTKTTSPTMSTNRSCQPESLRLETRIWPAATRDPFAVLLVSSLRPSPADDGRRPEKKPEPPLRDERGVIEPSAWFFMRESRVGVRLGRSVAEPDCRGASSSLSPDNCSPGTDPLGPARAFMSSAAVAASSCLGF